MVDKIVLEVEEWQLTLKNKYNIYTSCIYTMLRNENQFILSTSFINNVAVKESNLTYPDFTVWQSIVLVFVRSNFISPITHVKYIGKSYDVIN